MIDDPHIGTSLDQATGLSDEALVARVRAGDLALFELLVRRHNGRTYRTIRSVLRNDSEAEDVMQLAYLAAFRALSQFDERARFSTWLTRIALNEALMRLRQHRHQSSLTAEPRALEHSMSAPSPSPERSAANAQIRRALESAVDTLSEPYRVVFVLREVEGMSSGEVAAAVGISEETVRTRLHRAKARLQEALQSVWAEQSESLFAFAAPRCDRITAKVMAAVAAEGAPRA